MIWNMNPVAFEVFGLAVRWYGLVYVVGFFLVDWLAPNISTLVSQTISESSKKNDASIVSRKSTVSQNGIPKKIWSDATFGAFLWGVIGGRLGEFLFYNQMALWNDPLEVFRVWHGGMSIHGGLLGSILFLVWFTRRQKISFWQLTDSVVIPFAFVLGFGRIVNYVNGELVGVPTGTDWGVVFPHVDNLLRHPTQLYEALSMFVLGFFLLGAFLWIYASKSIYSTSMASVSRNLKFSGALSTFFLMGYGIFRFIVEYWKDSPVIWLGLTMGQVLCMVMIGFGAVVFGRKFYSK